MQKYTFILDVDGVLSTGQYLYSNDGKIYKIFGPHDHDGLKLVSTKIEISFISADRRGYEISERRVHDMGFGLQLVSEKDRYNLLYNKYDFNKLIYIEKIYIGERARDIKYYKNTLKWHNIR